MLTPKLRREITEDLNLLLAEGQVDFGIVVGQVNGANSMTFGQVGKPIVVTGGSINGTAITSANFSGFLHGTPGHKWSDANHKINAVWGE